MAFTTRGSLLSAVRRGNEIGWNDFYENYKPLILLRGGDRRLTQTEKEELIQLVMVAFFNASKTFHYDKSQGRFRDYLKRIIDNKAYDIIRKRQNKTVSIESDNFGLEDLPEEAEDHWKTEWQDHLLKQALQELKLKIEPTTYQSYHLFVIEGLPAKNVARMLEIKPNAVYQHKSRVEEMLREIVKTLED
jgi:RNA polymerase sigma factor (sigma-70 family)